ncbi:MAG: methyltransferase [Alphaproteobacteria bacterium]|nr:methyltransferase [Alphaproteobacteria bacterium]
MLSEAGEWDGPDQDAPDTLLGGQVVLRQPTDGYRVAVDPVLLAASVPASSTGSLLDIGTGVGAAGLCFAHRVPGARVAGLELQPELAGLARDNVALNGMDDRVSIIEGNILDPPRDLVLGTWDHVIANPPYLPADRADPPPGAAKAAANVEGAAKLADWIGFALRVAKPKGGITVVHRADRLDELLSLLHGRAGGIVVFPLWPKEGREAKRVILRARPGVKTPLRIAPGLVLHEEDGGYTADALAILRDGAALAI